MADYYDIRTTQDMHEGIGSSTVLHLAGYYRMKHVG